MTWKETSPESSAEASQKQLLALEHDYTEANHHSVPNRPLQQLHPRKRLGARNPQVSKCKHFGRIRHLTASSALRIAGQHQPVQRPIKFRQGSSVRSVARNNPASDGRDFSSWP